jgi:hypothetical protein
MSEHPWVATLRSLSGDTGWLSLSKSSGEANYPIGVVIDVAVDDINYNKEGYVDVLSDSTTISVSVKVKYVNTVIWTSFVLTAGQEYEVATMLKAISTALGIERTYNLLAAFGTYPAITVKQWQEMSIEPLSERIAAFKAYINVLEVIDIDEIQANDVLRTALKIRMLGSGGMRMIQNNNLRISI